MAKIVNDDQTESVPIEIYLAVIQTLIDKYGNFKMSQELHNMIIHNLAQICAEAERGKK